MRSRRTISMPYRSTDASAIEAPRRQQADGDPPAVQGRDRDQVEDGQEHVELHRDDAHERQGDQHGACRGIRQGGGAVRHRLEQQGRVDGGEDAEDDPRDGGQAEVRDDPRGGDVDRVPLLVAQQAKVDGDRLGPPEHHPRAQQEHHGREEDRPERIDVGKRVERHPPQHLRRGIPLLVRDPAVRRLVEGDRKDDGDRIYGQLVKELRYVGQTFILSVWGSCYSTTETAEPGRSCSGTSLFRGGGGEEEGDLLLLVAELAGQLPFEEEVEELLEARAGTVPEVEQVLPVHLEADVFQLGEI